jgi:hypothetical protein
MDLMKQAGRRPSPRYYVFTLLLLVFACAASPQTAEGQWTPHSPGSNDISNTNTGNVGIGTGATAPSDKLVVVGNGLFGGSLNRTNLWDTFSLYNVNPATLEINSGAAVATGTRFAALALVTNQSGAAAAVGGIYFGNSNLTVAEKRVAAISSYTNGATNSGMLNFSTANAGTLIDRLTITGAGNVGIGYGAPASKFTVADGNIHVQTTALVAHGSMGDIGFGPGGGAYWAVQPRAFMRGYFQGAAWFNGSALAFFTHAGNDTTASNAGLAERMRIDKDGLVGIGTTTPTARLHIYNGGTNSRAGLSIDGHGMQGSQQAEINLFTLGDGTKDAVTAGTKGWHFAARGNAYVGAVEQNDLQLYSWNGTTAAISQYWDAGGNVGIGTKTPATRLHVLGDSTVTGNLTVTETINGGTINGGTINAKYQDVAEWVPSSQKLAAGTVVALDPEKSNQVLASAEAYDTKVAGVISAQPGIALGEGGEGKVLVATTGRVKVKVDATRAPIKIGDLLVTSDAAGVAMKSEPVSIGGRQMHSPGTIIGKALEPLANGTGEILVLLSLQ